MRARLIKLAAILLAMVATGVLFIRFFNARPSGSQAREVMPVRGSIQSVISATGTVLPKNRLEVKPPVSGRVEEIAVREGDRVTAGQTLGWMSSTERAALIDAARGKGEDALKHWQDVYKPIPLISPIAGEVIVAKIQPGQTVTAADALVVLSDRLIVRAQVDETDIGRIAQGQPAAVTLDAYPDTKIKGGVDHIYYESKTVNNVTIYEVDVLPEEVPEFFRSGMNASIDFIEKRKEDVLLLPLEAVRREQDEAWVLVRQPPSPDPVRRTVTLGIVDDKNAEIVSGLRETDSVVVQSKKYTLPTAGGGTNPFLPSPRRR